MQQMRGRNARLKRGVERPTGPGSAGLGGRGFRAPPAVGARVARRPQGPRGQAPGSRPRGPGQAPGGERRPPGRASGRACLGPHRFPGRAWKNPALLAPLPSLLPDASRGPIPESQFPLAPGSEVEVKNSRCASSPTWAAWKERLARLQRTQELERKPSNTRPLSLWKAHIMLEETRSTHTFRHNAKHCMIKSEESSVYSKARELFKRHRDSPCGTRKEERKFRAQ